MIHTLSVTNETSTSTFYTQKLTFEKKKNGFIVQVRDQFFHQG